MNDQIEKQAIEEIAKVIERTEQIARDAHCGLPSPTMYAKDLYWKGYRKQKRTITLWILSKIYDSYVFPNSKRNTRGERHEMQST
jgi:hypothetical protein